MRITSLTTKGKSISVAFDTEVTLVVSPDVAVKFGLCRGLDLTDQQFADLAAEQKYYLALVAANRFIGYRTRSEREIREKLRRTKTPTMAIDRVINQLQRAGLLDDIDFGERYVHDALLKKPVGRIRMRYDLKKKGLTDAAIEGILADRYPPAEETAAAIRLLERRMRRGNTREGFAQKREAIQYLQSRGFSRETVERSVVQFFAAEPA